jgi:hypothetical protein
VNTFTPPFKVHICWFQSADDPRCIEIARELYEYLHRPLDDDFVLRPGVEIPVEVGRDLNKLLDMLDQETEPVAATRLVIALLDSGAFDDPSAHQVVKRAAEKWRDAGRGAVFLPLLLDDRWGPELQGSALEALVGIVVRNPCPPWQLSADVGVVAGRALLRRLADKDPPHPKVFISHAKIDAEKLAKELDKFMRGDTRVEPWLDNTAVHKGEELGPQLTRAASDGIVLVVRSDRYSESPWCSLELLAAKRARVPIVTLLAGKHGEPSTSAYSGNHRTLTWRKDRKLEIVARCVQAWLHGHYFRQYAAAMLEVSGLPTDAEILTRRPELLDLADGGPARRLIIHPDPPLTEAETDVLRMARPSVRLATPTTLFGRVLLANDPQPPLSAMTLALSLSNAEELPDFDDAVKKGTGLTKEHSKDVLFSIVTTTVHSGARIAYGGDFRRAGFTQLLSDLLRSRRRLGATASTRLLAFMRPHKQPASALEAKVEIEYSPVPVPMPEGTPPGIDDEVQSFLWHLAMREKMAQQSEARVLLGGKIKPKSPTEPEGYSGPWPGQLEEAWRTLQSGRGLFVAGGFSGTAGKIAEMLRTGVVPEAFRRATWPSLAALADKISAARKAVREGTSAELALTDQDGRLFDLEDLAAFVLKDWQEFCAQPKSKGDSPRWSNGLTKAENERLFVSTDRTEITHLVFEGLRRISSAKERELRLFAYCGDIALVPDVQSYAVTVTPGVPPAGASVALDKRLGGRLSAVALAPDRSVTVVPVGGDLVGSYVLVLRLDFADQTITAEQIGELAREAGREADRLGITSIACPTFGSTMGLTIGESVQAMTEGFEKAGRVLDTLVFCETDPVRYQTLLAVLGDKAIEMRSGPVAEKTERSPVLMVEAAPAGDGWKVSSTLFDLDDQNAVVPRFETTINGVSWGQLRRRARKHEGSLQQGKRLWNELLSDAIRARLKERRGQRLVVLTEENGSGLPWEFLTDDDNDQIACAGGVVRRIALKGEVVPPNPEPRVTRRVLLIVNPRDDLPHTVIEAENIQTVLRDRPDIEVKRLEGNQATLAAVVESLETGLYDILHYAGHAHFDAKDRSKSGLILAGNQVLTAGHLPEVRPPRFVYLSGCESLRVRGEAAPADKPIEEAPNSQSLAEALLRKGVSALVGTFFVVADGTAQKFASEAYRSIMAGQPLGSAVLAARRELKGAPDWGNFMLYGDDQLII